MTDKHTSASAAIGVKSAGSSDPLWMQVSALIPLILGVVAAIALTARWAAWAWSPFILIGVTIFPTIYLLRRRPDPAFRMSKAFLDTMWNIWSAVGAAILINAALKWSSNLEGMMRQLIELDIAWSGIITFWITGTACGRIAVSVTEFLNVWKPLKKPKDSTSSREGNGRP